MPLNHSNHVIIRLIEIVISSDSTVFPKRQPSPVKFDISLFGLMLTSLYPRINDTYFLHFISLSELRVVTISILD